MRKSRLGSISNWMLWTFTVRAFYSTTARILPTFLFRHSSSLCSTKRVRRSQLTFVTFDRASICDILCLCDQHFRIFTINSRRVVEIPQFVPWIVIYRIILLKSLKPVQMWSWSSLLSATTSKHLILINHQSLIQTRLDHSLNPKQCFKVRYTDGFKNVFQSKYFRLPFRLLEWLMKNSQADSFISKVAFKASIMELFFCHRDCEPVMFVSL